MEGLTVQVDIVEAKEVPLAEEEEKPLVFNRIHTFLDDIPVGKYSDPSRILHIEASKSAEDALKLMASAGVSEAHVYDDSTDGVRWERQSAVHVGTGNVPKVPRRFGCEFCRKFSAAWTSASCTWRTLWN
jgi:hypothetical protein